MSNAIPVKSAHRQIKVYSIKADAMNDLTTLGPAIRKFLLDHGVGLANFHIAKQNNYLLLIIAQDNDQTDWNEITGFGGLLTSDGLPDFTKFSNIDIP